MERAGEAAPAGVGVLGSPMRLRVRKTSADSPCAAEGGRASYLSGRCARKRLPPQPAGPTTKSMRRESAACQRAACFGRPMVFEANCTPPAAAVVFLHGFGDAPESWVRDLAAMRRAHPQFKWCFLRAGRLPITCYRRESGEYHTPAWGDFVDAGIVRVGSRDHDSSDPGGWYGQAAQMVAGFIRALQAEHGLPASRIFLVGQSQGAAAAAHAALEHLSQHEERLGGLAMLQGWLLPAARSALAVTPPDRLRGWPVLIEHGTADGEVAFDCAQLAQRELQRAGANLTFRTLPGLGHFLDEAETRAMGQRAAAWIVDALADGAP
jgi:predicted esterase